MTHSSFERKKRRANDCRTREEEVSAIKCQISVFPVVWCVRDVGIGQRLPPSCQSVAIDGLQKQLADDLCLIAYMKEFLNQL